MDPVHVRQARKRMATDFELTISCEAREAGRAARVLDRAQERVGELERELSEFLPESPIHRLNRAAPGERVPVTAAGIELLERSARIREATGGAFDCAARSAPAACAGGERVAWDRGAREAWRLDDGARVGFGAIGKGYALDQVRCLLEAEGFRDYLLVAGGSSIVISGFAGPGRPWTWGWSWRKDESGARLGLPFAHASGDPIAIGVSGTDEQGLHLIDPARGAPAASGVVSALVAHASAADADALSTALFVAGWDRTRAALSGLLSAPGLAVIGADRVPRWNGIFQRLWGGVQALVLVAAAAVALASPARSSADELAVPQGARAHAAPAKRRAPAKARTQAKAKAAEETARKAEPEPAPAATPEAEAPATPEAEAPATPPSGASLAAPGGDAPPAAAGAPVAAPAAADPAPGSAPAADEGEVTLDLGAGADDPKANFNPHTFDRHAYWAALPFFTALMILLHLRKNKLNRKNRSSF